MADHQYSINISNDLQIEERSSETPHTKCRGLQTFIRQLADQTSDLQTKK